MADMSTNGTPRNPWKWTAIAMGIAMVTALITGMVVASRPGSPTTPAERPQAVTAPRAATPVAASTPAPPAASRSLPQAPRSHAADQAAIQACNDHAAAATGPRAKGMEVVKDATVGAVLGAAVGAAGGAIADGGKGAGKGAAIGGLLGAGAGSLYGVNENKKHDAAYRDAYANCMRSKGYAG